MARAKQVYRWPLRWPRFNLVGASAGAATADLCTIHSILIATVEAGERSEAAAAPEKKGVWCDSESTVGKSAPAAGVQTHVRHSNSVLQGSPSSRYGRLWSLKFREDFTLLWFI